MHRLFLMNEYSAEDYGHCVPWIWMCDFIYGKTWNKKHKETIHTLAALQIKFWNVILRIIEGKLPNVPQNQLYQCQMVYFNAESYQSQQAP